MVNFAGLFGGPEAANAKNFKKFVSPLDKKVRFEISDLSARLRKNYATIVDNLTKKGETPVLAEIFDHKTLFENYPDLALTKIKINPYIDSLASFEPNNNTININPKGRTLGQIRSSLLHEVQHGIQEIENFARGTDPMSEARRIFQDPEQLKKYPLSMGPEDVGRDLYLKNAGEAEARLVQKREPMTADMRAKIDPYSQLDINPKDAIVSYPDYSQKVNSIDVDREAFKKLNLSNIEQAGMGKVVNKNGNLELYHGSSSKNIKSIESSGELRGNTYFAPDEETALRFARQAGGSPSVVRVEVDPSDVMFDGNYFSSRQGSLVKDSDGVFRFKGNGANKPVYREMKPISEDVAKKIEKIALGKQTAKEVLQDIKAEAPRSKAPAKERQFITTLKDLEFTAPQVKEVIQGQYIPRSNDELSQTAKKLIETDITAAKNLVSTGSATDDTVATAAELIIHYQRQGDFDSAVQVAQTIAPKLTELGRGIQAASLYNKLSPEGVIQFATKQINEANKANPKLNLKLDGADAKTLTDMARKIADMPEGLDKSMATYRLMDYMKSLVPSSAMDKIVTVWKAGLLTGLKTSGTNIISTIVHGMAESVKQVPASVVDSVASLFTGKRTTTLRGLGKGTVEGTKEGLEKGWRFFRTGFDERNALDKFDYKKVNFGKNPAARVLQAYEETVFRALGTQDQPFFYGAKARSILDQAHAEAISKGLKGKEYTQFIDNFVSEPPVKALENAVADAEYAVFQNSTKLGNIASSIQRAGGNLGQFIVPFTRTPASVAMSFLNYSPVGFARTIIDNVGKGKFDQRSFSQMLGRNITGTAVFAVGAALMNKGIMTLSAPTTENERNQWELEGKRPNAVKIGSRWYSFGTLGPIGLLMGLGGYFQRAREKTGSVLGALPETLAGMGKVTTDQTFLKGLSGAINALNDPTRYAKTFLDSTAGSAVPTIIADLAASLDNYKREYDGPVEAIKNRLPGARNTLRPVRDAFGRPVPTGTNFVQAMADPFRSSQGRDDTLTRSLSALPEAIPTKIKQDITIGGEKVKLTKQQLDDLESRVGPYVLNAYMGILSNPGFSALDDDKRAKILLNVSNDIKGVEKLKFAPDTTVSDEALAKALSSLSKNERLLLLDPASYVIQIPKDSKIKYTPNDVANAREAISDPTKFGNFILNFGKTGGSSKVKKVKAPKLKSPKVKKIKVSKIKAPKSKSYTKVTKIKPVKVTGLRKFKPKARLAKLRKVTAKS